MSQSDPDWTVVDEELDVYGIGVASCNGHDDALKNTVNLGSGPTLDGAEIFIHMTETLSAGWQTRNLSPRAIRIFNLLAYLKLKILAPQIRTMPAGPVGVEVRYNQ
jgi:hypothetical protein